MGNLPAVDTRLHHEWVLREMAGLPEVRKRFEKPWEMTSPRETVHVGPVIQIHWRSPSWQPSTAVCKGADGQALRRHYEDGPVMSA